MSDLHFGHSKFESKLTYPHLGHFMESPHSVRDPEKQGHQNPDPHPQKIRFEVLSASYFLAHVERLGFCRKIHEKTDFVAISNRRIEPF
jgi:hypothetical protein